MPELARRNFSSDTSFVFHRHCTGYLVIALLMGFALGYGVRSFISYRRRPARAAQVTREAAMAAFAKSWRRTPEGLRR
jgi:hypothetical protein